MVYWWWIYQFQVLTPLIPMSYYPNIRLDLDVGNFKGDLEFHTNGYTGVGNGVGDFIFYKRVQVLERLERTGWNTG